jgi:soluble lytic murein transglycosylase-like protein
MQVMPANFKRCKLPHAGALWETRNNINCGAQIIAEELANYKQLDRALKVYNGGPKALTNRYPESEAYVVKVLSKLGAEYTTSIQ